MKESEHATSQAPVLHEAKSGFEQVWHSLISEKSLALGTWVLAIVTVLAIWNELRKSHRQRERSASLMKVTKVKDLDPSDLVGAFKVNNTATYLPIAADTQITAALGAKCDVVICGRPGIGKSHCAVHHIASYPNWTLLRPTKQALMHMHEIKVRRLDYILLLDDLNEYTTVAAEGDTVFDLVVHLRAQARNLIVIATVRNVHPEFEMLSPGSKLLGRWKMIVLPDWTKEQGRTLAQLTNLEMSSWDGTPLSVKQPSKEMLLKYESAPLEIQLVLRALKIARNCGITPIQRSLLCDFCNGFFHLEKPAVSLYLGSVAASGFLKQSTDSIRAYDPYLDMIPAVWDAQEAANAFFKLLVVHKRFDELLVMSSKYYSDLNYAEAEQAFSTCVDLFPKSPRFQHMLGIVYFKMRKLDAAEAQFRRVVKLAPKWANPWYRLGWILKKKGAPVEANHAYERGLSVDPAKTAEAKWCCAEILRQTGHLEPALRQISLAIQHSSTPSAGMFFTLGRIYQDNKRSLESIQAHERALLLDPHFAEANLGLGFALRDVGRYHEAATQYRHYIKLRPDAALGHAYLAEVLSLLKQPAEAESESRKAVELEPDRAAYHSYWGQRLMSLRKPQEAKREFLRALQLDPDYAEALVGLAATHRLSGDIELAIAANARAIQLNPRLVSAYFGLGLCHRQEKAYPAAVAAFKQALELDQEFIHARFYLAHSLIKLSEPKAAMSELKRVLANGAYVMKAHFYLAHAYGLLKDSKQAIAHLRLASDKGMIIDINALRSNPAFQSVDLSQF